MRSSSTSGRIGNDRRRAARAEPSADLCRLARLNWKRDPTHRNKDGANMMLTSLWILGKQRK
jgi:hypothetical protein